MRFLGDIVLGLTVAASIFFAASTDSKLMHKMQPQTPTTVTKQIAKPEVKHAPTHLNGIPSDAYNAALHAYNKYDHRTNYLIIVDFNLPSTMKRLWIVNVKTGAILMNTYVAHGSGSGRGIYATYFSNSPGSLASSLGAYRTEDVYYGHNGKSLQIKGLEWSNSNAERRSVVIHGSSYAARGGHSWGCFAVPFEKINQLISIVGSGTILYAYHS